MSLSKRPTHDDVRKMNPSLIEDVVADLTEKMNHSKDSVRGVGDITFLPPDVSELMEGQDPYASYSGVMKGFSIELEARINFNAKLGSGYFWNNLFDELTRQGLRYKVTDIVTTSFDARFLRIREEKVRGSQTSRMYAEYKAKGEACYDDLPYWIAYEFSLEKVIYNPPEGTSKAKVMDTVARDIMKYNYPKEAKMVRYSFQINDDIRVDMSQVTRLGEVTFEIEVELTNVNSSLMTFVRYARKLSAMARGTMYLYCWRDLSYFYRMINTNLYRGTDEKLRHESAFIAGGIFNVVSILIDRHVSAGHSESIVNGGAKYAVCHKTDGKRTILVMSQYGIWFIYPPHIYNLVCPDSFRFIMSGEMTVLDGELVTLWVDGKRTYRYYAFDCLEAMGKTVDTIPSLSYRLRRGAEATKEFVSREGFPRDILRIIFKMHVDLSVDDFFVKMTGMLTESKNGTLEYKTDGLIFTPIDVPYSTRPTENNKFPYQILKWKSAKDTTIDFRVVRNPETKSTELKVTVAEEEVRRALGQRRANIVFKDKLFVGSRRNPIDQRVTPIVDEESLLRNNVPDGSVVEMEYDPLTKKFKFRGMREEKDGPNAKETAESNFDNILSPLSPIELEGKGLHLAARYHTRIKSALVSERKTGGVLLDLGAGRGGVLEAQQSFSIIIAVEYSNSNADELKRRAEMRGRTVIEESRGDTSPLDVYKQSNLLVILRCSLTETETILQAVRKYCHPDSPYVNMVSLLDVGTFVWETKKMFVSAMTTIGMSLREGGSFVWKMMDGDRVIGLARRTMTPDRKVRIEKFSIQFYSDVDELKEGSRVTVQLPGSILEVDEETGGQNEFLTRPNSMCEYLATNFNMEISGSNGVADGEKLLGPDAMLYSSLFAYGTMTKRGVYRQQEVQHRVPTFSPLIEQKVVSQYPSQRVVQEPERARAPRTTVQRQATPSTVVRQATPSTTARQSTPSTVVQRQATPSTVVQRQATPSTTATRGLSGVGVTRAPRSTK